MLRKECIVEFLLGIAIAFGWDRVCWLLFVLGCVVKLFIFLFYVDVYGSMISKQILYVNKFDLVFVRRSYLRGIQITSLIRFVDFSSFLFRKTKDLEAYSNCLGGGKLNQIKAIYAVYLPLFAK